MKTASLKIGDTIRSFDFQPREGRPLNYMEGIVWKIDDTFAWFNPTIIVRDGCIADIGIQIEKYKDTTRTPKQGNLDECFEYEGRITILKAVR